MVRRLLWVRWSVEGRVYKADLSSVLGLQVNIDGSSARVAAAALATPASFFAEIIPFRLSRPPEPLLRIERIVGVEGDTRRGRKPFPHPFPARMPLEVARAAISALIAKATAFWRQACKTKLCHIRLDPMTRSQDLRGLAERGCCNRIEPPDREFARTAPGFG
jgi:hypothetical protein